MREYLQDKKIVGAMCISRNVEMLKVTIPNLLKNCDWILLLLDNESDDVRLLVEDFQREYYDKIFVRRSSIPHNIITRSGGIANYHRRWKGVKGIVRDEVFVNLRRIMELKMENYNHIDIVLFPDQDEIFTDYLPELLVKFWDSEYRAVTLKMIHVIDDMRTIKDDPMLRHVHILKYSKDLSGLPWQFQNHFHPIKKEEVMPVDYYSIHLAYYGKEQREWRNKNWKTNILDGCNIWKLDKDIEHYSPGEIQAILNSPPHGKFNL